MHRHVIIPRLRVHDTTQPGLRKACGLRSKRVQNATVTAIKGERAVCYNCGCGKPGDDMGDPKNITDKTFEEAAKASKQSPKEAKRKTLELLKIILKKE